VNRFEKNERIIGIDPGSHSTGVGVIKKTNNRIELVHRESIVTKSGRPIEEKLETISDRIADIIEQYQPDHAAIEKVFHSINARTSLVLGHVRGVILLTLHRKGIEIGEYAPNTIKQAVVGAGKAGKEQVQAMVKILLNLDRSKKLPEDEADALACAICHAHTIDILHRTGRRVGRKTE
jgi:crossover junction endodeoxyribonuclease RuvC